MTCVYSLQVQSKEGARSPCTRLPLSEYSQDIQDNQGSACKSTGMGLGCHLNHSGS